MIDEAQIDASAPFNDNDLDKPFTGDKLSFREIQSLLNNGIELEELRSIVYENRHVFLHFGYKLLKSRSL